MQGTTRAWFKWSPLSSKATTVTSIKKLSKSSSHVQEWKQSPLNLQIARQHGALQRHISKEITRWCFHCFHNLLSPPGRSMANHAQHIAQLCLYFPLNIRDCCNHSYIIASFQNLSTQFEQPHGLIGFANVQHACFFSIFSSRHVSFMVQPLSIGPIWEPHF